MRRDRIILIVLMLATTVISCYAGILDWRTLGPMPERLSVYKKRYKFDTWPGKNGPNRCGLKVRAQLPNGFRIETAGPANIYLEQNKDLIVQRFYTLGREGIKGKISLHILVANNCSIAQDYLLASFVASTADSIVPSAKSLGLSVGDIAFAWPGNEGGFSVVDAVRNNIYIQIKTLDYDAKPFVKALAEQLDRDILAQPTTADFRRCPNRPAIKQVDMSLGHTPKIIEATDPHGEKLEYSTIIYAGQKIPIAINESNVVAFPSSKLPWKKPKVVEFLKKFD